MWDKQEETQTIVGKEQKSYVSLFQAFFKKKTFKDPIKRNSPIVTWAGTSLITKEIYSPFYANADIFIREDGMIPWCT